MMIVQSFTIFGGQCRTRICCAQFDHATGQLLIVFRTPFGVVTNIRRHYVKTKVKCKNILYKIRLLNYLKLNSAT
uniref:Uncharacterized protein n=1 Tax=Romanomermis culicivorax TaxID=13658 RepID=A0A915K0Q7_ROMCU